MVDQSFPGPNLRPLSLQIEAKTIAGFESAGTGRPILLIHGNSSSSHIWQKQLQGPLGAKYRVIAIDLPGHGASSPPPHPETDYSGTGYAAAIAAVARVLDLRSAVVVGWSLGGHAVLNAASLLPMAAGLMIFGTPPVGHGPEAFAGFKNLSPTAFTAAPTEAQIEAWVHTAFAPGYASIPAFVVDDFRRTDGNARACLGAVAQAGGLADEVEIVRNLKIPLAIAQGGDEQIVDLGYLQRLPAPTLWRSKVQVVDGAGHSTQWEKPEAFDALLDAFASGV
ncbi:alpha/beta fold hydrolase [Bradyrhizobium commune]|uniref:Alpha/beta hydrolase n=1 Tax=Bradyrhizobium commune TaxID=83627 RepID=A0A7S9GZC1_9BRAD|nr:alpha/beta hydrolase [Bradyrhizobium commune]QPF91378.1 alpha/beta hydrolase [Bradyrhizobium commune]